MSNWVMLGMRRWPVALVFAVIAASCCTPPASAQCELDKLVAPDRDQSQGSEFGYSVALDGRYLVVGMPDADVGAEGAGAAYLFELVSEEAHLLHSLFADDGGIGHSFGLSVDIDGDLIVVGADEAEHQGVETGAVYVFHRNEGGPDAWGPIAKLVPSDGGQGYRFGYAVAISGDTVVVGSRYAVPRGGDSPLGTAHVFQHEPGDPSVWQESARLDGNYRDDGLHEFGAAVAIDSDTIVIGDWRQEVDGEGDAGAVYIFERDQGGEGNWGEVKKITADPPVHTGQLGLSVYVHGDTLIAGSPFDDNVFYPASGSAYIFERNHGGEDNWGQVQKLTASDIGVGDGFGVSVGVHDDRVLVGSYSDEDDGAESGSAYIFRRTGAESWTEVVKLTASDAGPDDWFGFSVAIDDDLALIGAMRDDEEFKDSGSAYVFDIPLGDIDGDCLVGPHDLILMLGAWGDCPAPENCHNCHMDLDGDCTVATSDLIILLGNWG